MSLDNILKQNQNIRFSVDRTDNRYMQPGNKFDMSKLGSSGGEVYKVYPEPGKADHPCFGFPGHKDVIEKTSSGEMVKFRIPYS